MDGFTIRPAEAGTWPDVEELFGPRGACEGCWCMFWRLRGPQFRDRCGEGARQDLCHLVSSGAVPGLLAYVGGRPVGWCAVAPRTDYVRLQRSPMLSAAERGEPGVWSVPCFYTARGSRGTGVAGALLEAAVAHATEQGARAVEGYPVDTARKRASTDEMYTGTVAMFAERGFREVSRRTPRRVVMRRDTGRPRG